MPRPERPLDPDKGPVAAFAHDLRMLREEAGLPKYLQMSRATGRSRTALAEAAGGDHLPTWETVEAFVSFCGGDTDAWRLKWEAAKEQIKGGDDPPDSPAKSVTEHGSFLRDGKLVVTTLLALVVGFGLGNLPFRSRDRPAATPASLTSFTQASRGEVLVAYSRFGRFAAASMATAGTDGDVHLWSSDPKAVKTIATGETRIAALAFDPMNRNVLAVSGTSGLIRIWDTGSGKPILGTRGDAASAAPVLAFNPRRRGIMAIGSAAGIVKIWDTKSDAVVRELKFEGPVGILQFDLLTEQLAISTGTEIHVWDPGAGRDVSTIQGLPEPPKRLEFDPLVRNTLAMVTGTGHVGIWDSSSGKPVRELQGVTAANVIAFHPLIRNSITVGGQDGSQGVWDVSTGALVHTLERFPAPVTSMAFSANGEVLATAGPDVGVQLQPIEDWGGG
ncbi:helix-turn-helix domain-containing protein [Actinoplanes sp. CA-051413]|uniref:helix-turn-helix domain-containing protein n=1 Tax=Actinoplanes sp. CA-051413 TaxID=3239899 RepID=UPI003D98D34B